MPGHLVPILMIFPDQSKVSIVTLNMNDIWDIAVNNLPLVPDDFEIPEVLETERFYLRPLTINDVVKDYDAVMEQTKTTIRFQIVPDQATQS